MRPLTEGLERLGSTVGESHEQDLRKEPLLSQE